MTRKHLVVGALVAVAMAGAYLVGQHSTGAAHAEPAATLPATLTIATPDEPTIASNLRIPSGLSVPEPVAGPAINEPTGVLLGEVKVPKDLLQTPPAANAPEFVVPTLPNK